MKSMKLRINNKVLFGDTESTVIGVKKHPEEDRVTIEYLRTDIESLHRPTVEESRIDGIPLSINKLVELGFILDEDNGDVKYFEKGKHGILWHDGDSFYFYIVVFDSSEVIVLKEVFYVHELQNIWFELSDEELIKIK